MTPSDLASSGVRVRPASVEDAAALAAVEVAAMRAGYAEFAEDLSRLPSVAEEVAAWRAALRDGAAQVWLADEDGTALGLVACSPGRLDELMVLPDRWGEGIGDALLAHAEAVLRDGGARSATLWLYAENARARGFYERRGWQHDADADRGVLGPQVQYRKAL